MFVPRNHKFASLFAGALMAVSMIPAQALAATPPALYLTPTSVSVQKGSTITIEVREHSGTTAVNAVQADLTYPADKLQLTKIDGSGSAFEVKAQEKSENGAISIARGTTNKELKGDQLVSKLVFTAKEAGSTRIDFASTSTVLKTEDNTSNGARTSGASISIRVPAANTAPQAPAAPAKEAPKNDDGQVIPPANEERKVAISEKGGAADQVTPEPEAVPATGAGDELPETGPALALGAFAGMGAVGYGARNYLRSRRDLRSALKRK